MSTPKNETNETESKPTPVAPPLLTEEENRLTMDTDFVDIQTHNRVAV